jgi:hypothetical protein
MSRTDIKVVGLVRVGDSETMGPTVRRAEPHEAPALFRLLVCTKQKCTLIDDFTSREQAVSLGMKIGDLALKGGKLRRWEEDVAAMATAVFHVKAEDLRNRTRRQAVVRCRHAATFLARRMRTDHPNGLIPLTEIGTRLTGRDHTTVMHSIRAAEIMVDRRDKEVSCRTFSQNVHRAKRALEAVGYDFGPN